MAKKRLIVDTSVLIDYFRNNDKSNAKLVKLSKQYDQLFISSITEFEIYNGATSDQLSFWKEILTEISVLPFDSSAARIAAKIYTALKKQRKNIETADLFIAAVAVSNNLSLASLNNKDFEYIESLDLLPK